MDYQKELEKHKDEISDEDRQDLERLSALQKDIAVGGSAEDFIRHPFFKFFETHLNDMINDSKNKILSLETIEDLKAHKAAIKALTELKQWLNSHVIKGRAAKQAIDLYEQDTAVMNEQIQEAIDKANEAQ